MTASRRQSVRLIAYKAGISVANLYSYFPSKEAIFAAVAKPIRIVLREAFNAFLERETKFNWKSDSSARAFEEEVSSALGSLLSSHGEGFALLMTTSPGTATASFRPELESRLARNFSDDIAQGSAGRVAGCPGHAHRSRQPARWPCSNRSRVHRHAADSRARKRTHTLQRRGHPRSYEVILFSI